jgi:hypothetical protein
VEPSVSISKNRQFSKGTGLVQAQTGAETDLDLFGVRTSEPKLKKNQKKRLGSLGKLELLEEVRKIFPNATVTSARCTTPKPDPEVYFIPDCVIRVHRGHGQVHNGSLSPDQVRPTKVERAIQSIIAATSSE